MNKWEAFLNKQGVTKEQFAEMEPDKMAELTAKFQSEQIEEINNAVAEKATEDQVKTLISEALKGMEGVSKAKLDELQKALEDQGDVIGAMKREGVHGSTKTLHQEIKEKKNDILKIARGGSGEVELKALTSRASVSNSPAGFVLPDIGQLGVKERSLYNVLPKLSIGDGDHAGVVRYRDWDESTTVRAAAMVAEGAAFPESTATFAWYSKELRKVGDTLPVTEEFMEDEVQAAAELEMFLDVNVSTKIDEQLVKGDNTGQNLDGLFNVAPAYTAVNSGIDAPNLKDLAIKMRNAITRTRGSKYLPDMCVVSSSTMEDLVLAKDANNNYIFDENTGTLGGLTVVVDENMDDNTFIVGDRRYARIYEKSGVTISKGMVGQQFVEDEMTLKARKRLLLLVRTVDKTGFLKVADVDAALTTLGTAPA